MNKNTLRLTTGAMFVAIFAIMLIINRQTGSMFEEFLLFLMPIPMVAYSAKYGVKSSVPVLLAMAFMSVIFGTPLTIFYAVTEALIGLVLGGCIFHKIDMTKTVVAVISLSALVNVLNTIVFASFFGYDLDEEIRTMQDTMTAAIEKYYASMGEEQINMLTSMFTQDYLMRIMVISMIVLGLIQGFIVYQLSLLILRRLHFQVPKPGSIYDFRPPKWTGLLSIAMYLLYVTVQTMPNINTKIVTSMQTLFLCCYLYLVFFGFVALMQIMRIYVTKVKLISFAVGFILMMILPPVMMVLGAFYILGKLYDNLHPNAAQTDNYA